MNLRITLGKVCIRIGRFVESLAVSVMRPEDLVEFNRRTYGTPDSVEGWTDPALLAKGLSPEEKKLLEHVPFRNGNLLVLGVGGGREAIPLAEMGFDVTGMDFIHELVEKAKNRAHDKGLSIRGLIGDISFLEVPAHSYDVVWLSAGTYSSVPTRRRRIRMLARILAALVPEGYFLCQFLAGKPGESETRGGILRKAFAWLTLGNFRYEKGDRLVGGIEFVHFFCSEEEVRREFEAGGFEIVDLTFPSEGPRGGAVLRAVK